LAAGLRRRGAHIQNKEYAAIFRPLFTLAAASPWPLSLQDDVQVELSYEFSFAAQLPSRQYPLNGAIMPFMFVIFEGLRGGARQPMLTLTAPVFWLSGLQPNELVSPLSPSVN
jgi:hypothetical protein